MAVNDAKLICCLEETCKRKHQAAISRYDVSTTKWLDLNYVVELIVQPKFLNYTRSTREVILILFAKKFDNADFLRFSL